MQEAGDALMRLHIAQLTAQALISVVLAAVFTGFWRSYRRAYLLLWSWSWWASAASITANLLSVLLSSQISAAHPARLAITATSQVGAYWQAFLLLLGTRELVKRDTWSARLRDRGLVLLALLGVAAALAFAWDPTSAMLRLVVRVSLRAAALGLAFGLGGLLVLSSQRGERRLPPRLVGWAFVLYGANQLFYFTLITTPTLRLQTSALGPLTSITDLVLPALMGGGMIAWLLDEERERVVQATTRLEHLTLHDYLTELPNRTLFADRLTQALAMAARRSEVVGVATLSVDDYHRFSDHLGLAYGDELLRLLARRARGVLDEGDTLARLGEHELGLVLAGMASEWETGEALESLLAAMRAPLRVLGRELAPSLTGGISFFPRHGSDASTLLEASRRATRVAEQEMRGSVKRHDPEADLPGGPAPTLDFELTRAFANDEFVLHYQPIVETRTGRITAVEALLRWARKDNTLVAPGEFIGDLERMGLSKDLTLWGVRTAVRELRPLQLDGGRRLEIAINLSPTVCMHGDLPDLLARTLREAGIGADSLHFEITERAAMRSGETTLAVVTELKRQGARIALDDFGTGYSSLRYLREFPVDMVKIDGSFVRGLRPGNVDAALCAAIVQLAHSLGLAVTAEGIEREDQFGLLAGMGCDYLQGFALGRPVPAGALAELLRAHGGSAPPAVRQGLEQRAASN
ncbi:MAG: putative bifunctional diguanylate cyclase/phosphodiesterase [Thermoanaerobaculaceae bacterium]